MYFLQYDAFEDLQLSVMGIRGSAVRAVLYSTQVCVVGFGGMRG